MRPRPVSMGLCITLMSLTTRKDARERRSSVLWHKCTKMLARRIPMFSLGGLWCVSCWSFEAGVLWGILAWFLLVAFFLFAVASCLRTAKPTAVNVDDEESVIALDIGPQLAPWGAEIVCGEALLRTSSTRRKFHAL